MKSLYTAVATSSGDGRNGHARTDDGLIDVDVRVPVAMGGAGGATNPEQLFAAGYAACLHSALRTIGRRARLDVDGTEITARVSIGAQDDGSYALAVELDLLAPHLDPDAARDLLAKAHQVCPYSNATRGNIEVTLSVV